ncbi:MAG: PAS domain-containing protein, partial [Thermomicrobiales bacterium]
ASHTLAVEQMGSRSELPYDLVARRADGSTLLVELLGRPIRYEDRWLRLLTVRDVTQQRSDETALQASEARFRAVWEATSDAIALSAPDGTVLAANPAYQTLYGYDETAIVGHSFAVIFPEEHRAWAEDLHQAVFASQDSPQVFEAEVRRRDGIIRNVEVRADFVMEGGQPTALVSVVRDVTDRRVAEAALQAS